MKFSSGKIGRIFVLRLEDKERLPAAVEDFASEHSIKAGVCIFVGGIRGGGRIVAGPEKTESLPVVPMLLALKGVHEMAGVGTIFPDEKGKPVLHLHASLGRRNSVKTGCIRPGVEVWKVGEIILLEIKGTGGAVRKKDPKTGFDLLEP